MSVQLQEVLKTDTLEIQRQKFNTLALDTFNVLAGGTNLSVGTIGIDDGTVTSPGLYFGNEPNLGLYRKGSFHATFAGNDQDIFSFGDPNYTSGTPNLSFNLFKNLNSYTVSGIGTFTFDAGGGYQPGIYTDYELTQGGGGPSAPASGTIGSGATADIEIGGIGGSVTNEGSNYSDGIYEDVPFINYSRPTATYTGSISSPGSGYTPSTTFNNVNTIGGAGNGGVINVTIDANGTVSNVVWVQVGTGYQEGDTISVADADLGGGNGFGYTIDSIVPAAFGATANITKTTLQGTITDGGNNYVAGTYPDVSLTGGVGTGAVATITVSSSQSINTSITPGSGYIDNSYSAKTVFNNNPTATYVVTANGTSNYILDGNAAPALTFTPGNTYRFDVSDSTNGTHNFSVRGINSGPLPSTVVIQRYDMDGSTGAFVDVIVKPSHTTTDQLEYYCTIHDDPAQGVNMGNTISFAAGSTGEYGSGATAEVAVLNGGIGSFSFSGNLSSDYKAGDEVFIPGAEIGGGSGGYVTINSITNSVAVTQVDITNSGFGYGELDVLSASDADLGNSGSGSGFTFLVTGESVVTIEPKEGGQGYLIGDVLTFDGSYIGGSPGASLQYTVSQYGYVKTLTLTNPGSGYATDSVLSFSDLTDFGGEGSGFNLYVSTIDSINTSFATNTGNAFYAGKVGVGIDITSETGFSERLFVGGNANVEGNLEATSLRLADGSLTSLSLGFASKPGVGIFTTSGNDNSMKFTAGSGVAFDVGNLNSNFYSPLQFTVNSINTYAFTSGNAYQGTTVQDIPLTGGSGNGAVMTASVGFIGSINNAGSGYGTSVVRQEVTVSGGSGSGGSGYIDTDANGAIIKLQINETGDGLYVVGDTITVQAPIGLPQGSNFSYTITALNVISYVELTNTGYGYQVGDILTIADTFTGLGGGSGFSLSVSTITENVIGRYEFLSDPQNNLVQGQFTSLGLKATTEGLIVGTSTTDDIKITNTTISKESSGNLFLSPNTANQNDLIECLGTSAFSVPAGTEAEKPVNPPAGSIRFNTTNVTYEAYDGANWGSLGGTRDVDGNTYILPESAPGENENILFFYNDGVNSLDVAQNKISLYSATTIESVITGGDVSNIVQWEAGAAATAAVLPDINYVYYNYNLYSVDTSGTFDASNPPTHTTGTVTNGTVDLTYVSSTYGNLIVNANSIGVYADNGININNLQFKEDSVNSLALNGNLTNLKVGVGGLTPEYSLFNITNSGALQVNTTFGASETYTTVLDSSLRNFQLRDLQTVSTKSNLVKGTTNSGSFVLYDPTIAVGAKVTVVADNITAGEKEVLELSVIDSGSDIYNIEIGDVYTSASKIVDVDLDFNPSGNVRITYTLDASVAAADDVTVTVVSQRIRK